MSLNGEVAFICDGTSCVSLVDLATLPPADEDIGAAVTAAAIASPAPTHDPVAVHGITFPTGIRCSLSIRIPDLRLCVFGGNGGRLYVLQYVGEVDDAKMVLGDWETMWDLEMHPPSSTIVSVCCFTLPQGLIWFSISIWG
jgi:hypothetical protein